MATELMERPVTDLLESGITFGRNCLIVEPGTSIEARLRAAEFLAGMDQGSPWFWGDLLNDTERECGEEYAQLVPPGGEETHRVYAWVANRIPAVRRRTLSWSHHREVAALEEADQERFLDRAEEEGWSKTHLRQAVKEWKNPTVEVGSQAADEKEPEEADPGEPDAADEVKELRAELEAADREIHRLTALVESLQKTDQAAELKRWSEKYASLEGTLRQVERSREEAQKDAQRGATVLGKLRRKYDAKSNTDLLRILGV